VHLNAAACLHAHAPPSTRPRVHSRLWLRNPVAITPNGVDLPSDTVILTTGGSPSGEIYSWAIAKFCCSLAGFIQGLNRLLNAWAQVKQESSSAAKPWRLVIAGWEQGDHQKELEELTVTLGLGDSIHFVGPQFDQQKDASLIRADAFILPSFSEGLPMTVLETWSHRLPALMTPQCNLPDGFVAKAAIEMSPKAASIAVALRKLFAMMRRLAHRGSQHACSSRPGSRPRGETCLCIHGLRSGNS